MTEGAARTRQVLRVAAAALAIVLAGSAPSASDAPASPTDTAGAGAPLVIDTDMTPDNIVAILSLVRGPRVDVRAITVVGTGEAHCPGGMFVARSILTMLGMTQVPVACGRREPLGDAQPSPDEWRAGPMPATAFASFRPPSDPRTTTWSRSSSISPRPRRHRAGG